MIDLRDMAEKRLRVAGNLVDNCLDQETARAVLHLYKANDALTTAASTLGPGEKVSIVSALVEMMEQRDVFKMQRDEANRQLMQERQSTRMTLDSIGAELDAWNKNQG